MNKMLVAVFETENKAYEGLSALKSLHGNGDITLYASAVVSKNEKGELSLNTAADQGPVGTATGLFTGSLIGLLGGPVGLVVGAVAGSVAGLIFDVNNDDINSTFVDEVSNALTNGKTALIAEVDESWTVPVDTKLEALNAIIFRRLKYEVADEQLQRESEAIDAEFKNLEEEFKEAREEDKVRIKTATARLQKKAQATNDLVKKKLNESKSQFDAKVSAMESQMKNVKERRRASIEKRIREVKEEYSLRTQKLKQASQLIGEALGPNEEFKKAATADLF
jgi:uncharacterized membrane protein